MEKVGGFYLRVDYEQKEGEEPSCLGIKCNDSPFPIQVSLFLLTMHWYTINEKKNRPSSTNATTNDQQNRQKNPFTHTHTCEEK